jgi:hypothetical protein
VKRPDCVKDEHLEYLDRVYWKEIEGHLDWDFIHLKFKVPIEEAKTIVTYWQIEYRAKGKRWE